MNTTLDRTSKPNDLASHSVVVFGSTGKSGRALVTKLIAAGHKVTAFARDQQKAASLPPEAKVIIGNARDPSAVSGAIAGRDVVISALGAFRNPVCANGIRNVISGMTAHGVKRLIAISAYGTGDSRHGVYGWLLNLIARRMQDDKLEMENAIRDSGLDWTVVRPPTLSSGGETGTTIAVSPETAANGFRAVSRADIARYIVASVDDPETFGTMPTVTRA